MANKSSLELIMGNSPSRKVFLIFNYTLVAVLTIISVLPVIHIVAMSLSENYAVEGGFVKLVPIGFNLGNYKFIVNNPKFYNAFMNSVFRVVLAVPINLIVTLLVAYPFSKETKKFRLRPVYFWTFMITFMFGGGLIPSYMIIKYTGLMDSIWALIIPGCVGMWNILLLMNCFRELPKELEESAFMDGAGHFTILFKIFLPLSKATLATLTLFIFVGHWNSWFDGLIYFTTQEKMPLQTYLQTILTVPDTKFMTSEELIQLGKRSSRAINAAQIVVATLPIFIVYPFLQKYYSKGLIVGSVKG